MPDIYLTPAAIGYFTEFILSALITLYLAIRLRRTHFVRQTALLTCFFVATTLLVFLLWCDVALAPSQRLPAVFLENVAAGLCLIFLLQFAYHFPSLDSRKKWEALGVLGLTMLYTLWEAQYALYRFTRLSSGIVEYRNWEADYLLAAGFAWVPLVFIRQTIFADQRRVSGLRKLVYPQGRAAQGALTFAVVYLITVALAIVNILRAWSVIPTAIYQLSLSSGLMLAMFAVVIVYLNSMPETTSFMIKLAGITLTTLLMILSSIGWVIAPIHTAQYHPRLTDQQTLRFTPNAIGGYDVTRVPFQFDTDLGHDAGVEATEQIRGVALDFAFPFFGKSHPAVYVTNMGTLGVGTTFNNQDLQYHYGTSPAIFPLVARLAFDAGSGIYAKQASDRLTITWSKMPLVFQRDAFVTYQLVLHTDGVFEITYNGLPDNLIYAPDANPYDSIWLVGAVPGNFGTPPRQVHFENLPIHGDSSGLVQDEYLPFRADLHRLLAPIAYLILISIPLIIVGVPALLYFNIVKPLNTLLDGMRQVNAGNRTLTMPIQSNDEIGFLTESFNNMIAQLSVLVDDLEARVAERTAELRRLAITDPLTDLYNRRHLMILGQQAIEHAKRYQHPLATIMIDIDHFKQINDEYGHVVGDEALRQLANYLRRNLRAADILGRFGGEEFIILMPETDEETARQSTERLIAGIRALRIRTEIGEIGFTTSIGIATLDADNESIEELISHADRAMYAAKQAGRNRIATRL